MLRRATCPVYNELCDVQLWSAWAASMTLWAVLATHVLWINELKKHTRD